MSSLHSVHRVGIKAEDTISDRDENSNEAYMRGKLSILVRNLKLIAILNNNFPSGCRRIRRPCKKENVSFAT